MSPIRVGNNVIVRMVTYHVVGHIEAITKDEIVLSDASWVADSGRWFDALKTGKLNEVEPFPDTVSLGRGAVVDATTWNHPLPKEQK